MSEHIRGRRVSLYLHFPFCERKCRYCDFLSGPASEETRNEYIDLLCREIRLRSKEADFAVDTIFFGGGTPSLMMPSQFARVMETLRDSYVIEEGAEISMEVNPGTADCAKLRAYRETGVNRLSIGVQSLDDVELRMLGRIHTADEAREIFRAARKAGFSNVNLDLMSALPGQTRESWSRTLREAVSLKPEHISAYSLIIEEGTPFASMFEAGQLPALPSEDEDRAIYRFTGDFLAENGYRRYEISNYAREGYTCRHNIGYWTGHEYLGLGLGASSDLGGERFRNPYDMEEYRRAVEETSVYALRRERQQMTPEDRMEEFMFLGLRMTDGVSEKEFERRFGKSLDAVFGDVIDRQIRQGVIRKYEVVERGMSLEGGCPRRENSSDSICAENKYDMDHRVALTEYGLDIANHVMADYLL